MQKKTEIWVFVEQKAGEIDRVSLQPMHEGCVLANKLGGDLHAVILGYHIEHLASILGHYGARKVYVVDNIILDQYNPDAYVSALVDLIIKYSPYIILIGSTSVGRDLAPRLAARMKASFVADCTALNINEGKYLTVTRPIFSGKLSATVMCTSDMLQIVTILSGSMEINEPDRSRQAEIVRWQPKLNLEAVRTEIVNFIKADPRTMDLAEAEIIVAIGKGLSNAENLHLIQQLADILDSPVGGSREAVDAGWIPFERQIGLTGKTVLPKLIVSCGISGQYPYVVGIEDASIKIAINTDRNAPIFKFSDLGIIGDLREVIPVLIKEISEMAKPVGRDRRGHNSMYEAGS